MKNKYFVLSILFMLIIVSDSHAASQTIASDGSWKSYNKVNSGWNGLDYDDSGWRSAVEYYGGYWTHKFWDVAIPIWDWPGPGIPTGMNGPLRAYFRKKIILATPVVSAFVTFAADDSAAVYVNGALIAHASNGVNIHIPADLFNLGENILAIYANDGRVGNVYERTREIAGFYFTIETGPCKISTNISGVNATLNPLPLAGQSVKIDVELTGDYLPEDTSWTLTANGRLVAEGASLLDGVNWDGRDGSGNIVPGTYDLMISATTRNGCLAEQSITAVLELTDNCKLRVTFPQN